MHAVAALGERLRERLVHALAQQQSVQEHDDSGTIPVIGVRQRSAFVAERRHRRRSPTFLHVERSYSTAIMPYRVGSSAARRPFPPVPRSRCCCAWRPTSGSSSSSAAGARRPSRRSTTATTAASSAFCRHMLALAPRRPRTRVQHTFMAAYRAPRGSARPIQLRPWLYTIARNRCLTMLRARRERPLGGRRRAGRPSTFGRGPAAPGPARPARATSRELPEDQRAALVLAELGAVSHDEIAHRAGRAAAEGEGARVPGAHVADRQPQGARDAVRGDPRAARQPARRRAAAHDAAPPPARVRGLPRVPRRGRAASARRWRSRCR